MAKIRRAIFSTFVMAPFSGEAFAQGAGLLPEGVGLYQLGYRAMNGLETKFNETNSLVRLGKNFDRNFVGPEMLTGRLGADLKKLATALSEFEGKSAEPGTLAGDIKLGQMKGDVEANVNSTILGLGFGLNKHVTLFAGLPFVSAEVKTRLTLSGSNNASEILDRLGGAAFDELREGLEKAAALNTDTVKETFLENGYAPIDEWRHSGVGDLRIGAKTGTSFDLKDGVTAYSTSFAFRVEIPTGYRESPDVLTDINFGRGYYALGLTWDQNLSNQYIFLGSDAGYVLSFDTALEKRVPEGSETTMPKERTTRVKWNPGDEIDVGGYLGGTFAWFTPRYRLGFQRHFSDRYQGDLLGNYEELARESDSWRLNHEVSLTLDTSKAYRAGTFKVPLIASLKGLVVGKGLNTSEQKYIELSIASFFSTPMARKTAKVKD